jgi:putative ABC transport system ATP-binding protein
MSENGPILSARGLVKHYDGGRVRALDGVDLDVARGEFLSVVGPSGSGKSTLLHMLGALDRPDSGRVLLEGRDLAEEPRLHRVRARDFGFVFQLHNLLPALTARENVDVPLRAHRLGRSERETRVRAALEAVGLADRLGHRPGELSGGERQRTAIARAVVTGPKVVLADEPTGDLDQEAGRDVLDLLQRLRSERGMTLVLVTHARTVAALADRGVRVVDGRVVEEWTR